MPKISKNEFVACVKKSRVMKSDQLKQWLSNTVAEGATELATKLIKDELITRWQAKYLLSGRSKLDVGSYRLLERTQRDELGDRFLAIHKQLGRKVDIQVLPVDLTSNEDRCEAFIQKASATAKLDHQNLSHVYDIDQESGRYFLVTEDLDGDPLPAVHESLTDVEVAKLVKQSISGIQYAHQLGVEHGDLRPSDIVITSEGTVKIQNLALSPLRTKTQNTNADDYQAIGKIGHRLISKIDTGDALDHTRLLDIFTNVASDDPELIEAATSQLDDWLLEFDDSADDSEMGDAGEDPFDFSSSSESAGGFDEPVESSLAELKRPKPSQPSNSEDDPEAEDEGGKPLSGLARIAQDNPVGLIAAVAAIALLLIGGTAYGAYRMVTKPAPEVANVKNDVSTSQPSDAQRASKNDRKKPTSNPNNGAKKKTTAPPTKPNDFSKLNETGFLSQSSDAADPKAFENKVDELIANRGNQNKMPTKNQQGAGQDQANKSQNAANANQPADAAKKPNDQVANMQPEANMSANTNAGGDGSVVKQAAKQTDAKQTDAKQTDAKQAETKPAKTEQANTEKTNSAGASKTASKKVAQPKANVDPFTKLSSTFELPDLEDLKERTISSLVTSNRFLMGAELDAPEEICKTKLIFEMGRSSENKQKWMVSVKRRPRENPTEIAYFLKTDTEFKFGWLPEAAKNKYAPFLRNCFIKLMVGDFTKWIGLRNPVLLDPLQLTAKEPFASLEAVIPSLPRLESISIEVLPLKLNKDQYSIDPSKIIPGGSARILLKRNDSKAIVWIQTEAELKTKLKIDTGLVLLVNGQVQPIKSAAALNNLITSLKQYEIGAFQNWEKAKATKAKKGQGDEFDRIRKEYEKVAKLAQSHTEKAIEYRDLLPNFLNQPISLRIYSSLGDKQIILAKMKKSTESE